MKPLIVLVVTRYSQMSVARNFWRLLSRVVRLSPDGIGKNALALVNSNQQALLRNVTRESSEIDDLPCHVTRDIAKYAISRI